MTWDEIRSLASQGNKIGSHGFSHELLHQNQDEQTVRFELVESKRKLDSELQTNIRGYAFANGDDQFVGIQDHLQNAGYSYALTLGDKSLRNNYNPYFIPRYQWPYTTLLKNMV